MTTFPADFLQRVHDAATCLADLRALAAVPECPDAAGLAALLRQCPAAGNAEALTRLLHLNAYRGAVLDAEFLGACLGVCEDPLAVAPCVGLQSADAIGPLLATARNEVLEQPEAFARLECTCRTASDAVPLEEATQHDPLLRFAAHDPAVWRETKPVARLAHHYRIRIGRDHRLLLYWQAGEVLRVLDLIPRQDLEGRIPRHG